MSVYLVVLLSLCCKLTWLLHTIIKDNGACVLFLSYSCRYIDVGMDCQFVGKIFEMLNDCSSNKLGHSLVKVQVRLSGDAIRLVKRFAESLRDSLRAQAPSPMLPTFMGVEEELVPNNRLRLKKITVYVPASGVYKVKVYARILRSALRSCSPLPKFQLLQQSFELSSATKSCPIPETMRSSNSLDVARIRQGMRAAREARDV